MTVRLAPLLALLVAVGTSAVSQGCAAPDDAASGADDALTTDLLASKKDFFAQEMLFVRVKGWSGNPDDLKNQRDDARLGDAELEIYATNAQSDEHCPTSGNKLVFKTKAFALRTSGNLTNGTPKSSYKIALDDKEDRLFGMKDLNLKSMWNDVSQMREAIAWKLFAQAGVAASQHTYAKLCVDGRKDGQPFTKYMGLYSVIEQVDKAMLKDHFGKKNDGGNLYKAYHSTVDDLGPATLGYRVAAADDSGKQYKRAADNDARTYQLKSNDKAGEEALQTYDDLATLIRVLNGVTTPGDATAKFKTAAYAAAVENVFNAKQFLRWTALNALMGAWDNYWATQANYYLYNAGRKDAGADTFMAKPYFSWIPWDYDNTFGISHSGASWATAIISDFTSYDGKTSNMANLPALRHVFENDDFFRYYLDAIEHMNDTLLTTGNVGKLTQALSARVQKAAFLEGDFTAPAHTGRQFTNDEVAHNGFKSHELRRGSTTILGIEHFVRIRHDSVATQIAKLRSDRGMPRGSSAARFPAAEEPLPL